ncbi:MAG: thioredoxin-dependent thiol peroxidase [Myxococcota bacterium]
MLSVGETVAEFTLPDQAGQAVTWSSLRGTPVVVFFYPKADTPGCTKEACAFRDLSAEFAAAGARVIGISADPPKRQKAFDDKYTLGMPLLSDPDHAVLAPWGVWGEKKMYGKTVHGIVRTTVLFDADGRVAHVWSPVKVDGHVDQVLARVRSRT